MKACDSLPETSNFTKKFSILLCLTRSKPVYIVTSIQQYRILLYAES